jgi:hypothetical protein
VIVSYVGQFQTLITSGDKKNAAVTLETAGALVVVAASRAALFTEFTTREAVGEAIDALSALEELYLDGVDTAYGSLEGPIGTQFIPDHDTLSVLQAVIASVNQILIGRAFDLKSKRTLRLTAPSDPLSLTWQLYADIDMLAFFLATNRITGDQFIEIPSGAEVVAYG